MSQAALGGPRSGGDRPTMPAAAGPRTTPGRRSMWQSVRDKLITANRDDDDAKMGVADAVVAIEVIRADRMGKVDKLSFWKRMFGPKREKVLWPVPLDRELGITEEEWERLSEHAPEGMKCCITMEMMKEPAQSGSLGISYDRPAITRWIEERRGVDPHDPQHVITLAHLSPNHSVRALMKDHILREIAVLRGDAGGVTVDASAASAGAEAAAAAAAEGPSAANAAASAAPAGTADAPAQLRRKKTKRKGTKSTRRKRKDKRRVSLSDLLDAGQHQQGEGGADGGGAEGGGAAMPQLFSYSK